MESNKKQTDTVKGWAIILMLFHHLFGNQARIEFYELSGLIINGEVTAFIANDLKFCVATFALVSGYGMTRSHILMTAGEGYKVLKEVHKKVVDRYLNFIKDTTVILLGTLMITTICGLDPAVEVVWGSNISDIVIGLISNMLGLAGAWDISWFIGSWWYVSVAISFIFIFPIMYDLLKKTGPIVLMFILLFICPYILKANLLHDGFWRYVPAFAIGVIFAEYRIYEKVEIVIKNSTLLRRIAICLAIIALYIFAAILKNMIGLMYITQTVMAVTFSMLIFIFGFNTSAISAILNIVGKYSKGIWLIHVFVYGRFMDCMYGLKNIWLILFVVLLVSFMAAVFLELFWSVISIIVGKNRLILRQ